MPHLTRHDIAELRDSQLNVFASLGVYASVWFILQVFLKLFDVDMPIAQLFDRHGNFSYPGILVAVFLMFTAFIPHWIMLRRKRVRLFQAARLVRAYQQALAAEEETEGVRHTSSAGVTTDVDTAFETPAEDSAYWQQRWDEIIKPWSDEDRGIQN